MANQQSQLGIMQWWSSSMQCKYKSSMCYQSVSMGWKFIQALVNSKRMWMLIIYNLIRKILKKFFFFETKTQRLIFQFNLFCSIVNYSKQQTIKIHILYLQIRLFSALKKYKIIMKLILALILLLTIAYSDSCGGNCPSTKCPHCVCGSQKKIQDISAWCAKYSWNQACCKCIVSQQSAGNANAINFNTNGSYDVGLWQINNMYWGQCNAGKAPCDTQANLQCAIKIYQWNKNSWHSWSAAKECNCL